MKNRLIKTLTAAFILIGITSAFAEDRSYISISGTYGFHNKSEIMYKHKDLNNSPIPLDYKNGLGGAIAVGRIMDQFRIELEGSYRKNASKAKVIVGEHNGIKAEYSMPSGLLTSNISLMLNAYYDIPVSESVSFYLGAGAGISFVHGDFDQEHSLKTDIMTIKSKIAPQKKGKLDTVFAWQVMAGITYHIDEDWELFTGYRLFATAKPTYSKQDTITDGIEYKNLKITQKNVPLSHNFEVGLRFKF